MGKKLIGLGTFAVLIALANFFVFLWLNSSEKIAELGQSGDFFGGWTNPILTLMTFIGVLFTIQLQHEELALTRSEIKRQGDALEKQNFESTFFQMLNLHNSIVSSVRFYSHNGSGVPAEGVECFQYFYNELRDRIQKSNGDIESGYAIFWRKYRQQVAHYYRYLLNIIKFVDQSGIDIDKYMLLIRAQLSDYDLVLLLYNASTVGGSKFKYYISKYHLLEDIPDSLLISADHLALFDKDAFGTID